MKICSLCGTTYDNRVDFCFRDGTPLQPVTEDTDVPESPLREALPDVGPPTSELDAPDPSSLRFDDVPEPGHLQGVLPDVGSDLPEPQHLQPTPTPKRGGISESPTIPVPLDQAKPFLEAEGLSVDEPVHDPATPEPVTPVFGGAEPEFAEPVEDSDADGFDDYPPYADSDEPPPSSNTGKIFGGAIAVILLLGIGGVLLTNDKGDEPEPVAEVKPAVEAPVEPPMAALKPPVEAEPVVEPPVEEEPVEEEPVEEPEVVADAQPADPPRNTGRNNGRNTGRNTERAKSKAIVTPVEEPDDNPWGDQPAEPQPAAKVALRISTDPPGATVSVDGRHVGTSPTSVEVDPGTHQVGASMDGYESATIASDAQGDATTALVTLKKKASTTQAVKLFGPPGAQVFLEGRSIGFLPVQTELKRGNHAFKVVTADGTAYTVNGTVNGDTSAIPLSPP